MNKVYKKIITKCMECPHSYLDHLSDYKGYCCNKISNGYTVVEGWDIDERCPLEDGNKTEEIIIPYDAN